MELIIITDVGPRLIRFGFLGRDDLAEFPADLGQAGGNTFQQYGGHRLWHAPESRERTYYPDNAPVMLEQKGEGVRVIQPTEPTTGVQKEMVLLHQDPARPSPQKIGASAPDGWSAYARDGHLFVKTAQYIPGATYPDFDSSFETFADGQMLELESLGPLTRVEPGGVVEHTERWFLWRDVPTLRGDDDVDEYLLPKLRRVLP